MKPTGNTPNKKKGNIRRATGIKRRPSIRGYQYAPALGWEVELERMQVAEKEQCKVDKFWGLDLQHGNCTRECMLMSFEDSLSKDYQRFCRNTEKQAAWKDEFARQQYQTAYDFAVREQENRRKYMGLLLTAKNSEAIMTYRWSNAEDSTLLGSLADIPSADMNAFFGSTSVSQVLTLPPPDIGPRNIPLHLDGIQQSKSLSKGDVNSWQLGPSLRNRNVQSVVEEALSINNKASDTKGGANKNKTGILRSTAPEISSLTTDELLKAMEPVKNKHNYKLDGHPQYKWDQEIILKTAFRKLDARRRGFITIEDVAQVAQNVSLQELLSFTVFGSWVKKKNWKKFVHLCDSGEFTTVTSAGSGSPNAVKALIGREYSNRERAMSLQQWLNAAYKYAREYSVSRIHIRTDSEHRAIVANEERRDEGEVSSAAWFADYSRQALNNLERHASVIRSIQEGDCVWALHGRGVLWMPAIVERIIQTESTAVAASSQNSATNAKLSSKRRIADSVVFDLSYFMSNDAFQSARAMESARKLLELPHNKAIKGGARVEDVTPSLASMAASASTLVQGMNPISSQRPALSEKILCEAVFDEICRKLGIDPNGNSEGNQQLERTGSPSLGSITGGTKLPTNTVIKCLTTEASVLVTVKLSAALGALFQSFEQTRANSPLHMPSIARTSSISNCNNVSSTLPFLLQALQASFPKSISKIEFVEYCIAALELSVFKTSL